MNLKLRTAKIADLSAILRWVPDEAACLVWAGPKVRYPAAAESVWADIEASEQNAFCMVSESGEVVGFGQAMPRGDGIVHLARIIVAPAMRGRGSGRHLCRRLMVAAGKRRPIRKFTLNVYEDNFTALALYRSLGFSARGQHDPEGVLSMSMAVA